MTTDQFEALYYNSSKKEEIKRIDEAVRKADNNHSISQRDFYYLMDVSRFCWSIINQVSQ